MLTILACPKPFDAMFGPIQRRALASWRAADPEAEILIFGTSEGTVEAAASYGAKHVERIPSNPAGVPYFDAVVQYAAEFGRNDLQVYLNADILLPPDFLTHVSAVRLEQFLMVGQRIDLALGLNFDITLSNWRQALRSHAQAGKATLHGPTGMDYFVFRRNLWKGLKPLVIGRGSYDSALLAFCLRRKVPIVDASRTILALHQGHDYSHVPGGKLQVDQGPEAHQNRRFHDVVHGRPLITDADFILVDGKLQRQVKRGRFLRRLELQLRYRKNQKLCSYAVCAVRRTLEKAGICPSQQLSLVEVLGG